MQAEPGVFLILTPSEGTCACIYNADQVPPGLPPPISPQEPGLKSRLEAGQVRSKNGAAAVRFVRRADVRWTPASRRRRHRGRDSTTSGEEHVTSGRDGRSFQLSLTAPVRDNHHEFKNVLRVVYKQGRHIMAALAAHTLGREGQEAAKGGQQQPALCSGTRGIITRVGATCRHRWQCNGRLGGRGRGETRVV